MRLGIFGGSFDPIHYGHLLLAECCREQARLDQVHFVPALIPPHKQHQRRAEGTQRVEMLKLAIGGQAEFAISTKEIARGGVSYTVETLAELHRDRPDDELFLLIGADSLADLPTWREPGRICELAALLVVRRAGMPEPDWQLLTPLVNAECLARITREQIEMPPIGLSSRDIRHRVQAGQSIRYRTPRAVEMYIQTHSLYRSE